MKILNLYAGIGGNRKLWTPNGDEHEIIAVENNPKIAEIYKGFYPNDEVVIADAHEYLLALMQNSNDIDFIWSSPPCPSHSILRKHLSMASGAKPIYPDMKLYEEILLLQGYFKGNWVVENVKSWYKPLIKPQILQRHYFWSNKIISPKEFPKDQIRITGGRNIAEWVQIKQLSERHQIVLPENAPNKRTLLRNCVSPELGKYILEQII